MLALTLECWGNRAHGKTCFILFSPPFLSLSFYFELGFYLYLQRQINSVFFAGLEVCVRSGGGGVHVRLRPRKKGSGGLERNEGVQGQSEGTDLLSQPEDEELIQGGNCVATEGEVKKKKLSVTELPLR